MELDWDKTFPDDYKLRNLNMGTGDKLLESYFKFSYAWGREAFRILKPGAFILVFSAVLTVDALSLAFRQIGFEKRDTLIWQFTTGFPRGRDMGMVIDEDLDMVDQREAIKLNPNWRSNKLKGAAGFDRLLEANQPRDRPKTEKYYVTAPASEEAKLWDGWFTRLRPSYEPIAMFQKPREGSFLDNLRKWGVGALNIDANRIPFDVAKGYDTVIKSKVPYNPGKRTGRVGDMSPFAGDHIVTKKWDSTNKRKPDYYSSDKGRFPTTSIRTEPLGDGYDPVFLVPKPTITEKGGKWNDHPSVKPLNLMEQLVKLVAPDKATILDPFCGSGTTCIACEIHDIDWVGFDLSKEYLQIAMKRMKILRNRPDLRRLLE